MRVNVVGQADSLSYGGEEIWSVVGIVGQYGVRRPFVGGYRLPPRYSWDLSNGPLFLPVTGG